MAVRPLLVVAIAMFFAAWNGTALAQSKSGSPLSRISTRKLDVSDEAKDLRFADYEERLNALLKTRRDEEKKFVHDVMEMVKQETLPERLVETSYKWVANKRPGTDHPFVYFEQVLRIQANLLKITLPPFDYSIYEERVYQNSTRKKIPGSDE